MAPLEMPADEFRAIGHRLVDQIAERLASLPDGPVTPPSPRGESARALDADAAFPSDGADAGRAGEPGAPSCCSTTRCSTAIRAFSATSRRALRRSGCSATCWRRRSIRTCGAWTLAPLAHRDRSADRAVDRRADRLSRRLRRPAGQRRQHGELRLPARRARGEGRRGTCATTGVARRHGRGWCCTRRRKRTRGSRKRPICSGSAPTRSAGFHGRGSSGWTWRSCARQIEQDRERGDLPFLVVGTAGSVSTGAVDPLPEIAAHLPRARPVVSRRRRLRRAGRARSPGAPADPARAGRRPTRSPSIRTNGCMRRSRPDACWCATRTRCAAPSRITRPTITSRTTCVNYFDYGPQNSRGFRALKVWLALRQVGRARRICR